MADDVTPAPEPPAGTPKHARGLIKKAYEETVSTTEKLIVTARKTVYAGPLGESEIDDPFLTALSGKCGSARDLMGQAVDKSTDKTGATVDETRNVRVRIV